MFASETYPHGLPGDAGNPGGASPAKKNYRGLEEQVAAGQEIEGWRHRGWPHIIEIYTACQLTKDADLFPALLGLAKGWATATKGEYLAGLFRRDLELGLLWHQSERVLDPVERRPAWRAPSWSWASFKAAVRPAVRPK